MPAHHGPCGFPGRRTVLTTRPDQRISVSQTGCEALFAHLCTSLQFGLDLMVAREERADSRKAFLMGGAIFSKWTTSSAGRRLSGLACVEWIAIVSASKIPCGECQDTAMMRALITLGCMGWLASHSMMRAAPATRRFSSLGFHEVFGPHSTTTWNFCSRSWRIAVGWRHAVVTRPHSLSKGSRWAC